MKKLFKVLGLLTIAAALFVGCKDPSGSASDPYADCSEEITADEIVLSAGTWTLKGVMTLSFSQSSQIYEFKASVAEDGTYTFTSGTATMIMDLAEYMDEDQLAQFNSLPADTKELMAEQMAASMAGSLPEDASVSLNGTHITISATLDENALQGAQSEFAFDELPDDATIKANSAKTAYVISFTDETTYYDQEGNRQSGTETYTYYISKD